MTHTLVGGDGIGWWFGFDAAHAFDLMPAMPSILGKMAGGAIRSLDIYRDVAYMKDECRELARQIMDVARV